MHNLQAGGLMQQSALFLLHSGLDPRKKCRYFEAATKLEYVSSKMKIEIEIQSNDQSLGKWNLCEMW